MNIIHNAIDAMMDSQLKKLMVSTRRDPDSVYIEISDTGHGLDPQDADKIFSPFYSTKSPVGQAEAGRPTGTGLGLPSAAALAAKYGGRILVDGKPGEGAKFTVELPIAKAVGSG
jgi:signal transduction histidine kinase